MHRRKLLTGVATAGALSIAGCAGGSNTTESASEEDALDIHGQRFYFEDEKDSLGHLTEEDAPEDAADWQIIHNTLSEDEWQQKQINDIEKARIGPKSTGTIPAPQGLARDMDWMLNRTEEIFQNPSKINVPFPGGLEPGIQQEDDEITFTRAIIQSTQEAGVDSSGLADDMVANMAEYAEQQLDIVDFNDYKLSTLPSTEQVSAKNPGGHVGYVKGEDGWGGGNSGFRHMAGLLQYSRGDGTELKYTEMIKAVQAPKFNFSIRDPEESVYRSNIEEGQLETGQWPHHFVTALDYTKARKLEAMNENILGFTPDSESEEYRKGLGENIERFFINMVDDSGYNSLIEDNDLDPGSCIVSDEFGESLETDYILNSKPETRQYVEGIARGLYQIGDQAGLDKHLALTGTIENPEIRITDQDTANEIRRQQAYDQVREQVVG